MVGVQSSATDHKMQNVMHKHYISFSKRRSARVFCNLFPLSSDAIAISLFNSKQMQFLFVSSQETPVEPEQPNKSKTVSFSIRAFFINFYIVLFQFSFSNSEVKRLVFTRTTCSCETLAATLRTIVLRFEF